VYQGTLNGSKVCVKRMRVYTEDDLKKAAEVRCWRRYLPCAINNEIHRPSAKRL
jgi:hypothetical protein